MTTTTYQHITERKNIKKALDYVNQLLTPLEWHYYHQYSHALEVMERSIYLWAQEWLSDDEIEMVALAALFHDSGFSIQYDKNEFIGAKIAQNYLKSMLYDQEKIQIITEMILATDPDFKKPKNKYEEIIKDADLDNLWTKDFLDKTQKLKHEIEKMKHIKIFEPDWQHWSINFLAEHKYYTRTQKRERNAMKASNKKNLEKMLHELENEKI